MTKICTKCKIDKQITEFHKDKTRKDGYTCWCRECVKRHKEDHHDQILHQQREYREKYRNQLRESYKKYYWSHRSEIRKRRREYEKKYREEHQDQSHEYRKKYYQTHREYYLVKKTERKRKLGFIPLNRPFENSHAHHINIEHVVYIPKELHKSLRHNIFTGEGMYEINQRAFNYLLFGAE